jgi:hypothetical protein
LSTSAIIHAKALLRLNTFASSINENKKVMNLKTTKAIYWVGVILTSLWFGASGFFELTGNPVVWNITLQLGYPSHFIYILGVAKLSGVIVLLTPNKLLRLKEWVFAGIFFDITFAFFSKLSVIGLAAAGDAIVAFAIVATTYAMFRRLYPAVYSRVSAIN